MLPSLLIVLPGLIFEHEVSWFVMICEGGCLYLRVALDSSTPIIYTTSNSMHTNVFVNMLTTHGHEKLNEILDIVASDLDALFDEQDFHDDTLKNMIPIIEVIKTSDMMVKRAFIVASLTLSPGLQRYMYKDSDDCVDVEIAFNCNRVIKRYTQMYINFIIDERQLVSKVLKSQCVA